MFAKIALRNIQKSFKDYMIYFLTLMISVSVFFVFNSLDSSPVLEVTERQKLLLEDMGKIIRYLSFFISIVLGFLIIYANSFMMRRRKKEFGIYLLLGMTKRKVSLILLLETFFVGLMSLILGILCGTFASQCIIAFIAKQLEIKPHGFTFNFSVSTMVETIISFGIIFLVVMVFNSFSISRKKLINLLNANKMGQKLKIKNLYLAILTFALSLSFLGTDYYLLLQKYGLDGIFISRSKLAAIFILGLLGVFLLFMSLSTIILKLIQKSPKIYYKNLNIFSINQINNKINSTHISMAIVSLLLFISFLSLPTSYVLASYESERMLDECKNDIIITKSNFNNSNDYESFDELLTDNGIKKEVFYSLFSNYASGKIFTISAPEDSEKIYKLFKEYFGEINSYDNTDNPSELEKLSLNWIEFMKLSDYNTIAKNLGKERPIALSDHEFSIVKHEDSVPTTDVSKNYIEHFLKKTVEYDFSFNSYLERPGTEWGTMCTTVVVPDDFADKYLYKLRNVFVGNLKDKKFDSNKMLGEIENIEKIKNNAEIYYFSKTDEFIYNKTGKFFVIALGAYIGIIFLLAASAILALQQLSETSDNFNRYLILKKLGTENSVMKKSIFHQVSSYFLFPLTVAIINTFIGIISIVRYIEKFGGSQGETIKFSSFMPALSVLVFIYILYFITTYSVCVMSILGKKEKNIIKFK